MIRERKTTTLEQVLQGKKQMIMETTIMETTIMKQGRKKMVTMIRERKTAIMMEQVTVFRQEKKRRTTLETQARVEERKKLNAHVCHSQLHNQQYQPNQ